MTGPLRVYLEQGQVRVARDLTATGRPVHLAANRKGELVWVGHRQGASIAAVPVAAFIAWLERATA